MMGQVCCLVYSTQKPHRMPEEDIPKKTEKKDGEI
jgi:hypothetical protein